MNNQAHVFDNLLDNLTAYQAPTTDGYTLLHANELPIPLSAALQEELAQRLSKVLLNRYPDSSYNRVCSALKQHLKLDDKLDIMIGNGSDEIIHIINLALDKKAGTILSPAPSFVMYKIIAQLNHLKFVECPLNGEFQLELDSFVAAIKSHNPSVIFIANPNNPTGQAYPLETLIKIAKSTDGLLVIDEAYIDYGGESFLNTLVDFPNVILLRTYSKIGFAGARFGFAVGHKTIIETLNKIRLPYNISSLSEETIAFAVEHDQTIQKNVQSLCQLREQMTKVLSQIPELKLWHSQANFILCQTSPGVADQLHSMLKHNKILVRNLNHSHHSLANCLRISIGSEAENEQFLTYTRQFFDTLKANS